MSNLYSLLTLHSLRPNDKPLRIYAENKCHIPCFSGGNSEKIIENFDDLLKNKANDMLIHLEQMT